MAAVNAVPISGSVALHVVLQQAISLTKTDIKQAKVGLQWCEQDGFVQTVQIIGPQRLAPISLTREEWVLFSRELHDILDEYGRAQRNQDVARKPKSWNFGKFTVTLTPARQGLAIVFSRQEVQQQIMIMLPTLWKLYEKSFWVNRWLDVLDTLPIKEYQDALIDAITTVVTRKVQHHVLPPDDALKGHIQENFQEIFSRAYNELLRRNPKQNLGYFYQFFGELFYLDYEQLVRMINAEPRVSPYYTPYNRE